MAVLGKTRLRRITGRANWLGVLLGATLVAGVARLGLGQIARVEIADRADWSLLQPGGISAGLVPVALPTLGEWGMLAATLSLLAAGTSVIIRRRSR